MKLQRLAQFLALSAVSLPVGAQDYTCALNCVQPSNFPTCDVYEPSCYCGYLNTIIQCVRNACPNDADIQAAITYYQSLCQGYSTGPTSVSSGSNSDTISIATVYPNDRRIKYDPTSAWKDTSSSTYQSGIGSCSNGTKVTQDSDAKFSFDFSGIEISLFLVPSSHGGNVTVQIDGDPATSLSTYHSGSSTPDQCIPSSVFTKTSLSQTTHRITVQNGPGVQGSSAGTLEFNNIVYKGVGAVGTNVKKGVSKAVIGGSIGGVVGALLLIGAGITFFLCRRKRNSSNKALPPTPNQPMMSQQAMGYGSPTPTSSFPVPTQSSSPASMGAPVSAGYFQTLQPVQPTSSTHIQPTFGGQQQSMRPLRESSGSNIRPLSTWVERNPNNDRGYMS